MNGTMCPDRTFGYMALAELKENKYMSHKPRAM
jgi:hypothetical protein